MSSHQFLSQTIGRIHLHDEAFSDFLTIFLYLVLEEEKKRLYISDAPARLTFLKLIGMKQQALDQNI